VAVSDKDPAGNIRAVSLESSGPPNTAGGGASGEWTNDMTQRLSRMEGALDGLRLNQTITFSAVVLVSTIVIAVSSYSLVKIGTLEMRVNELPGRISAELRDLNNTLAQAITAAKQAPPQVIVIPAPANGAVQSPRTP
jgi:hypothetical protein